MLPERQLVTLEIDAGDADATGYEPVWRSGAMVGFVTSGGYGHRIGKSLAMALVAPEAAAISATQRAYCRRRAQNARHRALAIQFRRQGDAGMTAQALAAKLTMAHSALRPSASSSPPRRPAQSSNVKATRDDWLEVALSVLAIEGVDHVTVLALSERLDVSRSSFYWYFKNRDELLGALLDRWDEVNTRSIVASTEEPAASASGLQRLPAGLIP